MIWGISAGAMMSFSYRYPLAGVEEVAHMLVLDGLKRT